MKGTESRVRHWREGNPPISNHFSNPHKYLAPVQIDPDNFSCVFDAFNGRTHVAWINNYVNPIT